MPVIYEKEYKRYHICGKSFSMVLAEYEMGDGSCVPLMRYYGSPLSRIPVEEGELLTERFRSFDTANAVLPFAVPTAAHGDFRPVQFEIINGKGQNCTRLSLTGHGVIPGKKKLAGLPATYVEEEEEAQTLYLDLKDEQSGASIRVSYTLFEELDALAVSAEIRNDGRDGLILEQAGSVSLSLSLPGATEQSGEVYGISLVYSGNFQMTADQDAYDHTRAVAGINSQTFQWKLEPGENFQTPEAVLVYSDHGYGHLSQIYLWMLCGGMGMDRYMTAGI